MENTDLFNLAYEEWELKWNSLPPKEIFLSIFENIANSPMPFRGWIYECSEMTGCLGSIVRIFMLSNYRQISINKRYTLVKSFSKNEIEEYRKAFMNYIYNGSTLCMVKIGNACNIKQFLTGCFFDDSESGYQIKSNGLIKNNCNPKVFPGFVEIGDWLQIEEGDILLVIWGEGTVVFTLEKIK